MIKGGIKMTQKNVNDFIDWLWDRLNQEQELRWALDNMPFHERRQLEIEVENKLLDMD